MEKDKETVINITVPETLAIDAMKSYMDMSFALRKKEIKINKKQYYAFCLKVGLAFMSPKDTQALEKYLMEQV